MKKIAHPADPHVGNKQWNRRSGSAAAGPKDTSGGKSLDGNATNASSVGSLTDMEGPNSWAQSANKGKHYK
jgi:hypothetical protein